MKKLLMAAAVALAVSGIALADNTDTQTVTVTGDIIQELTVSAPSITMPDVVKPATGESASTVTLACNSTGTGTVTYSSGNGNPFANGTAGATGVSSSSANNSAGAGGDETGACGTAIVSGEADFFYTINTASLGAATDNGVTLTGVTCTSAENGNAARGQLDASGADTLHCGAAVSVASTADATTDYTIATAQLTVTYD